LIHELEKAGIKTLKDIKSKEKEKNNETMDWWYKASSWRIHMD
jgi:hypothetical protein